MGETLASLVICTPREFDCSQCRRHVLSWIPPVVEPDDLCAECRWVLTLPQAQRAAARALLEPPFNCPRCGRLSYNRNDARERYCGACHKFFDDAGQPSF